jgi:hypothetical protein
MHFINWVYTYYLKIPIEDYFVSGTVIKMYQIENIDLSGISPVTSLLLEEEYGET